MSFNINNFKNNGFVFGGARPNQFEVNIFPPQASSVTNRISLLVQATSLPAFIQEPVTVPYFGRQIKVHGDRIFQDWEVTVMNDQDFAIRALMEKWQNSMNTIISNKVDVDVWPLRYKTSAEVTQYRTDGEEARVYRFEGLFPTFISSVPLDWAMNNQYETFNVNFAYDYWEPALQTSNDVYAPTTSDDGSSGI